MSTRGGLWVLPGYRQYWETGNYFPPRVEIVVMCRERRGRGFCQRRVVEGTNHCPAHQPEQPGDRERLA